jgi:hypothetical protein
MSRYTIHTLPTLPNDEKTRAANRTAARRAAFAAHVHTSPYWQSSIGRLAIAANYLRATAP